MRRLVALLAAVLVAASCTPPNTIWSPSPAASAITGSGTPIPTGSVAALLPDMSAALNSKALPHADVFSLTRSVRGRDGVPAKALEPVRTTPPVEDIGTSKPFWTYDFAAKKNLRITATLRVQTDHAKWWVQDDITVDLGGLRQNASFFEANIYPTNRRAYGSEWTPGIDGDPRIDVMVAKIPGSAAGYFSSTDELPLWLNEFSAEREIIYLNSLSSRSSWNSIVAHEFCHMIQFGRGKRSSVWFNEGQAQLCEEINGFGLTHVPSFLLLPDTQLNDWPDIDQSQAYYGHALLFLEFLRQQAGGDALINAFIDHGIDVPADMNAVLQARGQRGLEQLYADFVAANAFIGSTSADAATSYPKGLPGIRTPAAPSSQDRVTAGNKVSATVHNYAARYIEVPRGPMRIQFNGGVRTKLLPTDPHSGKAMWWSDRADGMDSRLTRAVDMSKATRPTLSFWTWFDIEKDYDYGYVDISTDNGQRWTTLPAPATTKEDPNGANLGNGFTGSSGGDKPSWIRQEVDLSAYAGKQVLLRFEYVTDGALSLHGMAIDDIEIPGALSDDAESDNGWQADGFVRSTNLVAQHYIVQLLRFTDQGATVDRKIVDNGTLQLDVDTTNDRKAPLLAVTGIAVRTTQPLPFDVAVDTR
ncbi:MAG: immune inhibitor A [Chloroflexota bacterium]|nr:immune inhibitor A [Chloroflexota bacterium]